MFAELKSSWKTQINILWFGQAILMAMLTMSLPYWPLYIAHLGNYTPYEVRFWSTAIYIAPFLSSIVSSPIWGKLGDKFGYKSMVIRACFGLFLTQTLILFFSDVFLIFLFRLLQGLLAGFIVAAQAWALSIAPANENGATIGKLQSATAVGNLMGPLLGGVIATYGGYHSIFSSSSVICALVTTLFYFLLENTQRTNISKIPVQPVKSDKKISIFSHIKSSILSILLVIVTIQLAKAMITPVFALFVTEKLGGNDITVGILYAATGLMVFITAPTWGKIFDKESMNGRSTYFIIAGLLLFSALLQILHAYAYTPGAILILRLLWGICLGALLPVLLKVLIDKTDSDKKGLFLGFANSATKFGNLLGIVLGAIIEAHFGYESSFLLTALLYGLSCLLILMHVKQPSPIGTITHEKT